jgi:integrase
MAQRFKSQGISNDMKLRKLNGYYYVEFSVKGKPKRISTHCTTLGEAMKVVKDSSLAELSAAAKSSRLTQEAIGQIITGKRLKMSDVLEPFEKWMRVCSRSDRTITGCVATLRGWIRDMKLGTTPPAMVTPASISDWINDPASNKKKGSRAVALSQIRSLFAFMAANGWIPSDISRLVAVNMNVMSHEQKEATEREPFTDDEVNALVKYFTEKEKSFWLFATIYSRETGLRLTDICQLELRCFRYDPSGQLIMSVWTDKRDKRMEFRLSAELSARFDNLIPCHPKYLFPHRRQMILDPKKRAFLSIEFTRICEKLGIKGKSFHCLRHTAGSEAANNGDEKDLVKEMVDKMGLEKARKLLGHSSSSTTKGYVHK